MCNNPPEFTRRLFLFSAGLINRTKEYFETREGRAFNNSEIEEILASLASYGKLLIEIRLNSGKNARARSAAGLWGPAADESRYSSDLLINNDVPSCPQSPSTGRHVEALPIPRSAESCASGLWSGWGTDLVTQYPQSAVDTNDKAGKDA